MVPGSSAVFMRTISSRPSDTKNRIRVLRGLVHLVNDFFLMKTTAYSNRKIGMMKAAIPNTMNDPSARYEPMTPIQFFMSSAFWECEKPGSAVL